MLSPRWGGGERGGQPRGIWHLDESQIQIPHPWAPRKFQIPTPRYHFLPKTGRSYVKFPTPWQTELECQNAHPGKSSSSQFPVGSPPWGLTLIGALSPVREKSAWDLLNWYQMVRLMITWLYIVNDDSGKVEINSTLVRLLPLCLLVLFSFRVFQRSHYRTITTLPLVIYRL